MAELLKAYCILQSSAVERMESVSLRIDLLLIFWFSITVPVVGNGD